MAISISWANKQNSILQIVFQQGWSSIDFLKMVNQINDIFADTQHTIHVILDIQHSIEATDNLILLIETMLKIMPKRHQLIGTVTVLGQSDKWHQIFNMAGAITQSICPVHFADNLEQAYSMIDGYRHHGDIIAPIIRTERQKILYVEDNEINFHLVEAMLRPLNCDILHATDGKGTFAILDEVLPDVIIMDYHINGEDGAEVTRQLKANTQTQQIPVIALTADRYSRSTLMNAGCDVYLNKPIRRKQLLAVIRAQLESTQMAIYA